MSAELLAHRRQERPTVPGSGAWCPTSSVLLVRPLDRRRRLFDKMNGIGGTVISSRGAMRDARAWLTEREQVWLVPRRVRT